jgi:hypothetical protein
MTNGCGRDRYRVDLVKVNKYWYRYCSKENSDLNLRYEEISCESIGTGLIW